MTKSKSGRYLSAQSPMQQQRAQPVVVKPVASKTSQPVLRIDFGESGMRGDSGERWVLWRVDSQADIRRVEDMLKKYHEKMANKKREVPQW